MKNNEDLSSKPLSEIMAELARLEREINLRALKYNLYSNELCKRNNNLYKQFPDLVDAPEIQPKIISIGEYHV